MEKPSPTSGPTLRLLAYKTYEHCRKCGTRLSSFPDETRFCAYCWEAQPAPDAPDERFDDGTQDGTTK